MTEEVQGAVEVADTEEVVETTETQEAEQVEDNESEAVAEGEEEAQEVDYKSEAEKLEKDVKGRQEKINKQRAALAQSNQKIQQLQEQLNAIQGQAEQSQEPDIGDFDTHDEYVNALADYRAEKRVKERSEELLREQQEAVKQQQIKEQQEIFQKQEHEYRQVNPKYDAAKTELQSHLQVTNVPSAVADAIYEQASNEGNLAEVINYFGADGGENLSEFDRIAGLTPIQAAVEIYKIQQNLQGVESTGQKKSEKPLPKPIKSIKGKSKATKDLSKQAGSDILKWVNS